jgi:hypothetical protein
MREGRVTPLSRKRRDRVEITPAGGCNGLPLPGSRRQDERNEISCALGQPHHLEQLRRPRRRHGRRLLLAAGNEEDFTLALAGHELRLVDGGGQLRRDRRQQHVAPVQGVADRDRGEGDALPSVAVDEEAAVTDVADNPASAGRNEKLKSAAAAARRGGSGTRLCCSGRGRRGGTAGGARAGGG